MTTYDKMIRNRYMTEGQPVYVYHTFLKRLCREKGFKLNRKVYTEKSYRVLQTGTDEGVIWNGLVFFYEKPDNELVFDLFSDYYEKKIVDYLNKARRCTDCLEMINKGMLSYERLEGDIGDEEITINLRTGEIIPELGGEHV